VLNHLISVNKTRHDETRVEPVEANNQSLMWLATVPNQLGIIIDFFRCRSDMLLLSSVVQLSSSNSVHHRRGRSSVPAVLTIDNNNIVRVTHDCTVLITTHFSFSVLADFAPSLRLG